MGNSTIKEATLKEMGYLIEGARREGWNPGTYDAIPYYFTDPSGFFIESVDGRQIGCISAVGYDDTYGFMGFYIVEPEMRRRGYGLKLWNHAIDYLGGRSVGLDGVVAQQDNYRKSGFIWHHTNIRYRGKVFSEVHPDLKGLDEVSFPLLVAYDAAVYGVQRPIFLQHWITMPNCRGLAKIVGETIVGYGVIRKCDKGYKIGPLFADDTETAKALLESLAFSFQGEDIFLDVCEVNANAIALAKSFRLEKVFETARMYKGTPPEQALKRTFGVTSFELG